MRRHRKQNLIVRIGKLLLHIVLIGTLVISTYVIADNGLFKNTWNNLTQQEQVQEEVNNEVQEDSELPGEETPEDAETEIETPEVESGNEQEPEEEGEQVYTPPVLA